MSHTTPKFRRSELARSVLIACGTTAAVLAGSAALAQSSSELQRVEITGSSIKRINAEGALPVVVMKAEDIKASGVTSAADLISRISSVQGGSVEAGSVGGNSYGFTGISIHNIGETRTLVLLNGKRLAQFGGQTLTGYAAGFDVNAIPLSAIERVEFLTDGASAQYGADAMAGVVNFITKKNFNDGDVSIGFSNPQGGAQEKRVSATIGFGTLEKDNYSVGITVGHDERKQLFAADRNFATTGAIQFVYNGKSYRKQQFSASPIPANATDNDGNLINPTLVKTGACAPKSFRVSDDSGTYCGFDFVGELEIYPERKRDNLVVSAVTNVGGHELYADILLSRTSQVSRIAPVPGGISIPAGTPLHDKYLKPIGITEDSTAFYRLYDLGKRTNNDTAEFSNIVIGSKGEALGWDYNASISSSTSDVKGSISGYPGALAIAALRKSGLLDPFVGPGQQSAAAQEAINKTSYSGYWDGGVSKLLSLALSGSRSIGSLEGGDIQLGAGVNFNREDFESKPSLFAQGLLSDPVAGTLCNGVKCDQRFGDSAASKPYTAGRNSSGAFGELVLPVTKQLELGAQLRYDNYSDFGSATTAKTSFRWTPSTEFLVRGSLGTGFHAPTVPQVNALLRDYGVTQDKYTCTPALASVAAAQGAICQPGSRQYDQLAGGNSELTPEKSKQATIGFLVEPNKTWTFGADLWHVAITDSFGQLTEQLVFGNPTKFPKSWGSKVDIGTGKNYLAFKALNTNLGNSYNTGIDFNVTARTKNSFGDLTSNLSFTQMLRSESQQEINGPYYSDLADFGDNVGGITIRTKGRLANTLKTGSWANTLVLNFQSGYTDRTTSADQLDGNGIVVKTENLRIDVPAYYTFDWQTVWTPTKSWSLTGGVLNVFDKAPPLSISTQGTNRGQTFGYDARYYDSRGRTAYLNASYKF